MIKAILQGGLFTNPFLFSFNSVMPILLMVLVGILLRMMKWVDDDFAGRLNDLCFKFFIPVQIYAGIYHTDFNTAFDGGVLSFSLIATVVIFVLVCLIVPLFVKNKASQGAYIQGVFRGNIALIGTSLMQTLYGTPGVALMGVVMPVLVLLYNVCATWALARFSGNGNPDFKTVSKKIITNPFLIAAVLGLLTTVIKPPVPTVINSTISSLGAVGTPLALISLGATLKLSQLKNSGLLALSAGIIRQFIIPVAVLGLAVLLGFREIRLGVLLCIFLTPVASGSYVLAKSMKADHVLAAQILLMTTCLSFVSMLIALTLFRALGYL